MDSPSKAVNATRNTSDSTLDSARRENRSFKTKVGERATDIAFSEKRKQKQHKRSFDFGISTPRTNTGFLGAPVSRAELRAGPSCAQDDRGGNREQVSGDRENRAIG
jgi:hypothetical protein